MVVRALGRRQPALRDQETSGCAGRGPRTARPITGGADGEPWGRPRPTPTAIAAHLAGRYGTETPAVLALAEGRPELLDAAGARAPLPEGRGGLRRPRGDGLLVGRRSRPAHPGRPAGRPGVGRRRRPRWPTSSGPSWAGTTAAPPDRGRGLRRPASTPTWPVPASTRHGTVGRRVPAGRDWGRTGSHRHGGVGVTGPTPVTAIDAGPGGATDHLAGTRVAVDDGCCAAPGRGLRRGDRRRRGRGPRRAADWWPAGHRLGRRTVQVPARPAVVARPTDTAQVAAVLALCHAGPGPGHRGRRTERRVRRLDPPVRRGGPRPVRPGRHRRRGRRCPWSPTSGPAPSVRTWNPACVTGTDSPSATGPSRWTCPPWAGGWPVGEPASTPTATARSRTWSSASRWCWPTDGWSAPGAMLPGRPPGPTSPSCSWAARAPSG